MAITVNTMFHLLPEGVCLIRRLATAKQFLESTKDEVQPIVVNIKKPCWKARLHRISN